MQPRDEEWVLTVGAWSCHVKWQIFTDALLLQLSEKARLIVESIF